MKQKLILYFILFLSFSCNRTYTPKPSGYFRIDLPEKEYKVFESNYPYEFEFPDCAVIKDYKKDSAWINMLYPNNDAIVYLTYKKIDNNLNRYLEEARNFVYKHTVKADAIAETAYLNEQTKVYGILYDIKGNAASPLNFFVTDSVNHFIRGALYFNTKPNKDSLAPVINYIREDVIYLMETLTWKQTTK